MGSIDRGGAWILAAILFFLITVPAGPLHAQSEGQPAETRPLVVGVALGEEPFVIDEGEAGWTGLGIELWRHVADDLGLTYTFKPYKHVELRDALNWGEIDVAIGDFVFNADDDRVFTFSHPYMHTALALAVPVDDSSIITLVLEKLLNETVLIIIGSLLGLVLLGATVFWLRERRSNQLLYPPGHEKWNFWNGIMWALLLITAQEPDIFKNDSFLGRVVALLLLIVGVTVAASYIAVITSAVTVTQIERETAEARDLASLKLGTLRGTSAERFLSKEHLRHALFDDLHGALDALEAGEIEGVVADRLELAYHYRRHADAKAELFPVRHPSEYLAFLFQKDNPLARQVNGPLLSFVETPVWGELRERFLGSATAHEH